ncbi:MAG TPA: hypothetical protein VFN91_15870 [Myxococcaceae bacterium]|nr:hypothetical protein [Myxococcaceae bacterium]
MNEKILTRHPQRKSGRSISREKYEQIRAGILALLGRGELTHSELMHGLYDRLAKRFDGNTHWYGETVKLDLEARKVIERTHAKPQKYRRVKKRAPARSARRS